MKLSPVIARLRTNATYFGGRVFGASSEQAAEANPDGIQRPAAFVVPLRDSAELGDGPIGVGPNVEERFLVIALLDNTTDDLGLSAGDAIDDARASLRTALDGWAPVAGNGPCQYASGAVLQVNRQSLFYGFEFVSIDTASTASGEGGAVISYTLTVQLALGTGANPATVLGTLATNIAATLGGTRMASDIDATLESVSAGATKFQMIAAAAAVDAAADGNASRQLVSIVLRVHHALGASETERDYTEGTSAGEMLATLPTLTDPAYWRVSGVYDVPTEPSLDLPADVTRA